MAETQQQKPDPAAGLTQILDDAKPGNRAAAKSATAATLTKPTDKSLTEDEAVRLYQRLRREDRQADEAEQQQQQQRAAFLKEKNPKILGTRFESMLGNDPAKFQENLDALVAEINKIVPAAADFGGSNKGGGHVNGDANQGDPRVANGKLNPQQGLAQALDIENSRR